MPAVKNRDVFINAPFDDRYAPILHAIVYAVVRYGYRVRCALETDDSSEFRLTKISTIISECRFGIHDLSRTEPDGDPPLPRFNMPLELGLFLGAKKFGAGSQRQKVCLVLDREKHRYQRLISDISGQDIRSHSGHARTAVQEVTSWLRIQQSGVMPGGGAEVWKEYQTFQKKVLPKMCADLKLKVAELTFSDLNAFVSQYISRL